MRSDLIASVGSNLLKCLEFDTRIFGLDDISRAINEYLAHKRVYLANTVKQSIVFPPGVDNIVVGYLVKDAESFEKHKYIDVTQESLSVLHQELSNLLAVESKTDVASP